MLAIHHAAARDSTVEGTAEANGALDPEVVAELRTLGHYPGHILIKLIDVYLQEVGPLIAAVRLSLARGDRVGSNSLVHQIKGASASIGALTLTGLCRDFEARARAEGGGSLEDDLARIEREFARVDQALEHERRCAAEKEVSS